MNIQEKLKLYEKEIETKVYWCDVSVETDFGDNIKKSNIKLPIISKDEKTAKKEFEKTIKDWTKKGQLSPNLKFISKIKCTT